MAFGPFGILGFSSNSSAGRFLDATERPFVSPISDLSSGLGDFVELAAAADLIVGEGDLVFSLVATTSASPDLVFSSFRLGLFDRFFSALAAFFSFR